jgi:hypothetical protein
MTSPDDVGVDEGAQVRNTNDRSIRPANDFNLSPPHRGNSSTPPAETPEEILLTVIATGLVSESETDRFC